MIAKIQSLLQHTIYKNHPITSTCKLHGDASYREYFRIHIDNNQSLIVMSFPSGPLSASEEISNTNVQMIDHPFIHMAEKLRSETIPVPKVIASNIDMGIIILEDLGDELMFSKLHTTKVTHWAPYYEQAIDLIHDMQSRMKKYTPDNCIAYQRHFDATLFNWEFNHFLEFGLKKRLSPNLLPTTEHAFSKYSQKITQQLLKLPQAFVHRDFQSKNLIFHNNILHVIDFQDALTGPYVYDLVALLRDSYIEIPKNIHNHLLAYAAKKWQMPLKQFTHDYALVTIQRKLKDAGRFVYIDQVKGNDSYLQFIPKSLAYVKQAFLDLNEHHGFYELLTPFIPEGK